MFILLREPVPVNNIHGNHRDNFGQPAQVDWVDININPKTIKSMKVNRGSTYSTITFIDGTVLNVIESPLEIMDKINALEY